MDVDNAIQSDPIAIKTVMIVEDDAGIGSFLVQAIQQETPYEAVLATEGFQALRMLQTLKPDLLILDYSLPGRNGLEVYDQIHAIKGLEHIPVLIITAETSHIRKEVKARQVPLLQKPFDLNELLTAIDHLLA
jgi:DNA-binding response OmpR family regulator